MRVPLQVFVLDLARESGFVLRGQKLLPLEQQRGPLRAESLQPEILLWIDELLQRRAANAMPPDTVGGKDVRQGSGDVLLARLEIVREFRGR